jgi:hypothetical protein
MADGVMTRRPPLFFSKPPESQRTLERLLKLD